mmetsp:Transcript_11998/g.37985  ORF Transcript_11998/g.37985 Transcript_11998/m.37985 type:complete len:670 (+) Transcript_11998:1570-3579(+)
MGGGAARAGQHLQADAAARPHGGPQAAPPGGAAGGEHLVGDRKDRGAAAGGVDGGRGQAPPRGAGRRGGRGVHGALRGGAGEQHHPQGGPLPGLPGAQPRRGDRGRAQLSRRARGAGVRLWDPHGGGGAASAGADRAGRARGGPQGAVAQHARGAAYLHQRPALRAAGERAAVQEPAGVHGHHAGPRGKDGGAPQGGPPRGVGQLRGSDPPHAGGGGRAADRHVGAGDRGLRQDATRGVRGAAGGGRGHGLQPPAAHGRDRPQGAGLRRGGAHHLLLLQPGQGRGAGVQLPNGTGAHHHGDGHRHAAAPAPPPWAPEPAEGPGHRARGGARGRAEPREESGLPPGGQMDRQRARRGGLQRVALQQHRERGGRRLLARRQAGGGGRRGDGERRAELAHPPAGPGPLHGGATAAAAAQVWVGEQAGAGRGDRHVRRHAEPPRADPELQPGRAARAVPEARAQAGGHPPRGGLPARGGVPGAVRAPAQLHQLPRQRPVPRGQGLLQGLDERAPGPAPAADPAAIQPRRGPHEPPHAGHRAQVHVRRGGGGQAKGGGGGAARAVPGVLCGGERRGIGPGPERRAGGPQRGGAHAAHHPQALPLPGGGGRGGRAEEGLAPRGGRGGGRAAHRGRPQPAQGGGAQRLLGGHAHHGGDARAARVAGAGAGRRGRGG